MRVGGAGEATQGTREPYQLLLLGPPPILKPLVLALQLQRVVLVLGALQRQALGPVEPQWGGARRDGCAKPMRRAATKRDGTRNGKSKQGMCTPRRHAILTRPCSLQASA